LARHLPPASYMRNLLLKIAGIRKIVILGMASLAAAQTGATAGQKNAASSGAYIVKYYVADPASDSTYETGPLHIVFSDGTEIVKELPPKEESTENNIVMNQEGFSDPQLADDRQTIGWTDTYDNCGTSYAVPLAVDIYRSGRIIRRIEPGQMVWSWMFFDRGKHVAVVSGSTHGPEVGTFRLYEIETGRVLSEAHGDEKTQALKPNAPKWAKQLESRLNGGGEAK